MNAFLCSAHLNNFHLARLDSVVNKGSAYLETRLRSLGSPAVTNVTVQMVGTTNMKGREGAWGL